MKSITLFRDAHSYSLPPRKRRVDILLSGPRSYSDQVICGPFVSKRLDGDRPDKIRVTVRKTDPKTEGWEEAKVINVKPLGRRVCIGNDRFTLHYTTRGLLYKEIGLNKFWFKIEKTK